MTIQSEKISGPSGQVKNPINILLLIGIFCSLFLLFFGPRLHSDGAFYFEFVLSLCHDKDINFYNEREFFTPFYIPLFENYLKAGKTGYLQHLFTIGPAMMWMPVQCLLDFCSYQLINRIASLFTSIYVATIISAMCSLLGLIFLYRILCYYYRPQPAIAAVICLLLTTQLPAYIFITPGFPHAFGFFFRPSSLVCF